MGKKDFITVKISNENMLVQIHAPELAGDKVIASAHSRFLLKNGWKGSRKVVSKYWWPPISPPEGWTSPVLRMW